MRKIKFGFVFILSFLVVSLSAWAVNKTVAFGADGVTIIENNSELLGCEYLDFYAIPNSLFSVTNNGGAVNGYEVNKAFDRDLTTSFRSGIDNNVPYTDPATNETTTNFINYIEVSFSCPVTINRLLYGAEYGMDRGYPTDLNLYYHNGTEWVLINHYQSQATASMVEFDFGQSITLTKFKFEYEKVNTRHKYVATAREIIFLQPESVNFAKYRNIFTDYSETTLSADFDSLEKIENFCESLSGNVNFVQENSKILRAKQVLNGTKFFDSSREFTTSSVTTNKIEQYGNLESYARNDLKLSKFGTNRQVLGILAKAGEEITIYVDGDLDDPLPKIRFSQHKGSWQSWLSAELQLTLGKNTFIAPNFCNSTYTESVIAGGPIYLVNPYTPEEQSANVKVYVEGGTVYPVFGTGTSEEEYLEFLASYVQDVSENPTSIINITEIVTDHSIVTVNATTANEKYQSYSPQQAITNWNQYMDKLLEFGGIPQNSSDPLFNEKNLHIRFNIRTVQPWASAFMYAAGEHVGIKEGSQTSSIYGSGFGWGVTHEIGHMLDINERTVSETSNNMWSKFNEEVIENVGTRGNFSKTLDALTSDLTYANTPYFVTEKQNYLIWWYLEAWQNGFWGNLENCYRGLNIRLKSFYNENPTAESLVSNLTASEKQVFYASIVTGVDLGYYYERWGFSILNNDADPVFNRATASEGYNNLMQVARGAGYVDASKEYKLWYQNATQYKISNTTAIYSPTSQISILDVTKTEEGYQIKMFTPTSEQHLGFEILEGNDQMGYRVIGFSYTTTFLDTITYAENYLPNYKVVAVDNTFCSTSLSESKNGYWDMLKIEFIVGEEKIIRYIDPNSELDLPTEWREDVKLLGWLNGETFYGVGAVMLATEDLTFTAHYTQLYKLEFIKDGESVFKKYYEYGTEVNISELGLPDVDRWLVGESKIKGKITITGNIEVVAWDSPESPFVQVVAFSAMFIYALIAVVAVIFSWCDKKKQYPQKG